MVFHEVVDYVLRRGCGMTLASLKASRHYSLLMQAYTGLTEKFPNGTSLGTAIRAGHLEMGALFHLHEEAEALSKAAELQGESYDPETRVLIKLVGRALIRAAMSALPDSALKLALRWRVSDTNEQLRIAIDLSDVFSFSRSRHGPGSTYLSGMLNQPAERVLPRCYGPWKDGSDANCLGVLQMLGAFSYLARSRAYSCVSIRGVNQYQIELLAEDAERVDPRVERSSLLATDLSRIGTWATDARQLPDYAHFGIVLSQQDGTRLLVDPYMSVVGELPEGPGADKAIALLGRYRRVLPGLSVLIGDPKFSVELERRRQVLREVSESAREFYRLVAEVNDEGQLSEELFNALDKVMPTEFEQIALRQLAELYPGREWDRRMVVMMLYLGMLGARYGVDNIAFRKPDETCDEETRTLPASELREEFAASLHYFGRQAVQPRQSKQVHPVCEIGDLEYTTGVFTLSHVADALGVGEEVETQYLSHESFNQYRLLYLAGSPLRTGVEAQRAIRAQEILRALPARLATADRLLEKLASLRQGGETRNAQNDTATSERGS